MADKDSVEKYLENNPQFAKEYFDKKLRAEALTAAFSGQLDIKDTASFKDVNSVQEAAIIFELVQELQKQGNMEKGLHKVLQRIALIVQADRVSFFLCRSRNGIPELASCLFDVTPTSKYEANLVNPQSEIVFPTDMGIVGFTASSKKPYNVADVTKVRDWEALLRFPAKYKYIFWWEKKKGLNANMNVLIGFYFNTKISVSCVFYF